MACNNMIGIMRKIRILLTAVTILTAVSGCQHDYDMNLPLAITSRALSLTKDAGSTHILVYSDGDWKARFTRNVRWASLDRLNGSGNSEVVFTYSENYGISRSVGIIFQKGSLADTVTLTQAAGVSEPSYKFSTPSLTLHHSAAEISVGASTNIQYSLDNMTASVIYYNEEGEPEDSVIKIPNQEATAVSDWISNLEVLNDRVNFKVEDNKSSLPRLADILVSFIDAEGNSTKSVLKIVQLISAPEFTLESSEGTYDGIKQDCSISASANNIAAYSDDIRISVSYAPEVAGSEEWIINPSVVTSGLAFSLLPNNTEENRMGVISISYVSSAGETVSATYTVTQKPYPAELSFEDVRAMTAGTISRLGYIEGYVVSAHGSPNVVSSPQTGQFRYDRTENDRTAYIESLDGKYGFMLKFKSSDYNSLQRFSKVKILVKGAELGIENDPLRYTLSGLDGESVMEAEDPDEFSIPKKEKNISEITDDDIFTLVNVLNLEIMCKDGSYTNCTDGYSLKDDVNPIGTTATNVRWDVAPLICYDMQGKTIYMLTNAASPWRRHSNSHDCDFYSLLPQGAGTFRGIVVHDDVAPVRFGDLGRYQLRAMEESDIALDETPFSNTIVEWTWNDHKTDLAPETGSGSLSIYGATLGGSSDYNNVTCSGKGGASGEMKGIVSNGGINLTQNWWDFENNTGKYFDISFSTSGISGSCIFLGIVWGHGSMSNTSISGPAHWNLLYSLDGGETFNEVPDCQIIKKRYITWWSKTAPDATPGFTEHLRVLPSDCFGRSNVTLRLQVADTVTDVDPMATSSNYMTVRGTEKGHITASTSAGNCQTRIGTITVRYIK